MKITRLELSDFRNYHECMIEPDAGVNILHGMNGAGKTNVLEAVHLCAIGRSFRETNEHVLVRHDCQYGRISCQISTDRGISHRIQLVLPAGNGENKRLLTDGKPSPMSGLLGIMRCVVFSPEDLELIYAGPDVRRHFLDTMICQISQTYTRCLTEYNKALRMRNSLLRQIRLQHTGISLTADENRELDTYDGIIAEAGQTIANRRKRAIALMSRDATDRYHAITDNPEENFTISYICCAGNPDDTRDEIVRRLKESRETDLLRGTTPFGIHRDDVGFFIGTKPMRQFASQGQCRTAVLAVKLAQSSATRQISGEYPVLLLDDVMSELDPARRGRLLTQIAGIQTFITCTDLRDVNGTLEAKTYCVKKTNDDAEIIRET